MITIKQLVNSDLVDEASALLYKVYIEEMKLHFSPDNLSQLRIETRNNRHLLVDRFTNKAVWFGVFDDNQLIGCARLCSVDENHQLGIEDCSSSQPIFQYISQDKKSSCFEITKVATHPNYVGQGIVKRLFLTLFNYCEEMHYSAIACTHHGHLKGLFKKIGLPLKIESAFKYEPQDSAPVNFYFADYEKGEVEEVRKKLEYLENDLSNNAEKIFKALEMVEPILPTPFYWMDKNGVVLGINELFLKAIGTTREIIGEKPYDFYKKEIADHILQHNHAVIKREEILSQEEWIEDVTTKEIKCFTSVKAPLYDDEGRVIGIVGSSINITKEKQAEQLKLENVKLENEIKKKQLRMQEELAHVSRINSMGTLAVSIAHELNNPLASIVFSSGAAQRFLAKLPQEATSEKIAEILESIKKQAERAGHIIHELKNFMRKDSEAQRACLSINRLIENVLTFVKYRVNESNINIELKLDNTLPDICLNKVQIEQVVLNLLSNAIDAINASDKPERLITVSTKHCEDDKVCIIVADTGTGISTEIQEKLFTAFTTTKIHGMGIGLSLCYNIVEKHFGSIKMTSEWGKGTVFTVILPIKLGAEERAQETES